MAQRTAVISDQYHDKRRLTRWTALKYHKTQSELWVSKKRFNVVPAGRRSGKTEIVGKRRLIIRALGPQRYYDGRYFVAAPTRDQTKRIYWKDLKAMIPRRFVAGKPSESNLIIPLINGAEIHLLGMDVPERIEGSPWDGGILDEFGNMKEQSWKAHVRPALADRMGWCDLIGVPEGRNHYYKTYKKALAEMSDPNSEWGAWTWISADILPKSEIIAAEKDLDSLTFDQEYKASFINFTGRIYYNFDEAYNCKKIEYNKRRDLIFCFDFNISPGVAVVVQEVPKLDSNNIPIIGETVTGIVGEVYIPVNSNTPAVCNKLIQMYKGHQGKIKLYGDPSGGSGGTAKVLGSDWDIIRKMMYAAFGYSRVDYCVNIGAPRERVRVNSVNSRIRSVDGDIRLYINPLKAPYTVIDLEGVTALEGGSGEIDKNKDKTLTHLTDAIGYYIEKEFPVRAVRDGMVSVNY